jgi:hypothetical protein
VVLLASSPTPLVAGMAEAAGSPLAPPWGRAPLLWLGLKARWAGS